ncbi:hypothetical protein RUM44_004082 [Polyplax serrata]|uniref:Uncharacterized protein n=1 Tax=Polyplax serrata TaxID=468196 RepID=A0ABR1B1U0_POLSC
MLTGMGPPAPLGYGYGDTRYPILKEDVCGVGSVLPKNIIIATKNPGVGSGPPNERKDGHQQWTTVFWGPVLFAFVLFQVLFRKRERPTINLSQRKTKYLHYHPESDLRWETELEDMGPPRIR